ncbi:hypothetical protein [Rhodobacter capsulatus]|uniref:hypothetical protein n=1 Tax=Rhodobacter capsulatus TaxID=1061 RepID=UPI00146AD05A|nr:hypothetical protein [Rhodobacter capsulatus]
MIGASGVSADGHRRIVGADHAQSQTLAVCVEAVDHRGPVAQRPGPRLPDDAIDEAIDIIGPIAVVKSPGSGGALPAPIRTGEQLPARGIFRIGKTMAEIDDVLKRTPQIPRLLSRRFRVPCPPLPIRAPNRLRHCDVDLKPSRMRMCADYRMRTCRHRYARKHHLLTQVKTTGDHHPRLRIARIEGFRIDICFCK